VVDVTVRSSLSEPERQQVLALATALADRYGAPPLNDDALIALAQTDVTHVLARNGDELQGYAQLDAAHDSAEIAARPDVAADLLAAAEEQLSTVLVWAHGKRSPIGAALQERGYTAVRTLWQLRRPLTDLPPVPPHEVTIRPFAVGRDEAAWLALNAAAFSYHQEQGSWTLADLTAREQEPWFDPAGFLMAERDGELLGFHWTKVHAGGLGEVYVLAVAPAAQGMRLGKTLLAAGLHHLADAGQHTVLLYVEDSNTAGMALYEGSGFRRFDVDVRYRKSPDKSS
jgi:mycothiol synthase